MFGSWASPACVAHLSAEEHAGWQAAIASEEAELQQRFRARMAVCWDWVVTAAHDGEAERAQLLDDVEESERVAWSLLLDWQGDRCAICGARSGLVIDHDHATGYVRGLLCPSCNVREGFAGPAEVFGRYRSQNPAAILGVRIRYWNPFSGYARPRDLGPLPIDDDHPVFVLGRLLAT
jgi:hypothetical protein